VGRVDWDDAVAVALRRAMYDDLAVAYPDETAAVEAAGGFAALDERARVAVVATVLVRSDAQGDETPAGPAGPGPAGPGPAWGRAVGCASVRLLGPDGASDRGPDLAAEGLPGPAGELTKVFVLPSARRSGAGRALLRGIEHVARGWGMHALVLETGAAQQDAVRLYLAAGYRRIAPYPPYVGDASSLCFARVLDPH